MKGNVLKLWLLVFLMSASSFAQAETKNDDIPQVFTMSPTGVNLQTGGFVFSTVDFTIGPLSLERSWKALTSFTRDGSVDHHAFGRWNHNFADGVSFEEINRQSYTAVYAGGTKYLFIFVPDPSRYAPDTINSSNSLGSTLTRTAAGFRFVDRSGTSYNFYHHPALTHNRQTVSDVTYPDGSTLTYSYSAAGFPRTIVSNRGYAIVIDYGSNNRISQACGYNLSQQYVTASTTCWGAPVKVTYGYAALAYGPVFDHCHQLARWSHKLHLQQ